MATPFATASDLAIRLKVALWTGDDLEQVMTFIEDASDDLRGEIGWQVYPPAEVTVAAYPDPHGKVCLPGLPAAVTEVVDADGATLSAEDYVLHDGTLFAQQLGRVSVTYTVGYTTPPAELVKWTCVLAAQALAAAEEEGTLGATPSSRALADYRISYSERQQLGDLPIPDRVLERLRSTYGQGVHST